MMRTWTGAGSTRGDDRFVGGGRVLSEQRLPLRGDNSPCSRRSPSPGATGGPGALPRQCLALQATRVGSAGQQPPRLPSRPIRPSRLYLGDARLEGRDSPARSGRSEKEPVRAQALSPEEEGQTQTLGAERPAAPRPLREGSRAEETPRCRSLWPLTSPRPSDALWALDATPHWSEELPDRSPGSVRRRLQMLSNRDRATTRVSVRLPLPLADLLAASSAPASGVLGARAAFRPAPGTAACRMANPAFIRAAILENLAFFYIRFVCKPPALPRPQRKCL